MFNVKRVPECWGAIFVVFVIIRYLNSYEKKIATPIIRYFYSVDFITNIRV